MSKLMTSDKFFVATIIVAVAAEILYAIFVSLPSFGICYMPTAITLLSIVCLQLALFISYREHSKNAMKGLMGALLMAFFVMSHSYLAMTGYTLVFGCLYALALCLLLINHFVLNSDRRANPKYIKLNQTILAIIPIIVLVWGLFDIFFNFSGNTILVVLVRLISICAALSMIVCVESRLDAYRLRREDGGWTEEEGYPEEYDREKYYGR